MTTREPDGTDSSSGVEDNQAFTGTCPTCGQAYLAARVRKLATALEEAAQAICGEFCGRKHHPLCAQARAALEQP